MPIILGRPLLATAHAKVDIFRKSVSLEESQDKIDYGYSKLGQGNPWGIKAIEEPNIERGIDLSLRHSFDENHDDMIDMSVDPAQEINPNTEEDCKNLENFREEKMGLILDTVLDKLDDDIDDEAYKERMYEMLDMTYRKPPPNFIEKVEIEEMPRTSANVAAVRAELMKEMDTVGSVQRET
ncbi:hypothetical protein Tco_1119235 [Tanacetum coccineum]